MLRRGPRPCPSSFASPGLIIVVLPVLCSAWLSLQSAVALSITGSSVHASAPSIQQGRSKSFTALSTSSTASRSIMDPSSDNHARIDDVDEDRPDVFSSSATTTRTSPLLSTGLSFPRDWLAEDHYGGVTLRLDHLVSSFSTTQERDRDDGATTTAASSETNTTNTTNTNIQDHFEEILMDQLSQWQAEGKLGIWVHLPIAAAGLVPILARHQFVFHMVLPGVTTGPSSSTSLVMTRWLPATSSSSSSNADDTPLQKNRLPKGPTHQVGVGCLVYKPGDASQILVVQEKSGPAAFHQLWKMPTGLIDANEDIHEAAIRELYEETGLCAHSFDGLLCLRQAPLRSSPPSTTTTSRKSGGGGATNGDDNQKFVNSRKAADLFFVCRLTVADVDRTVVDDDDDDTDDNDWAAVFRPCPDEIAAIRWMNLADFVRQPLWQASPLYRQLNRVLLQHDDDNDGKNNGLLWTHSTLSIRHDMPTMKNTLYHPAGQEGDTDDSSASTTAPTSAL